MNKIRVNWINMIREHLFKVGKKNWSTTSLMWYYCPVSLSSLKLTSSMRWLKVLKHWVRFQLQILKIGLKKLKNKKWICKADEGSVADEEEEDEESADEEDNDGEHSTDEEGADGNNDENFNTAVCSWILICFSVHWFSRFHTCLQCTDSVWLVLYLLIVWTSADCILSFFKEFVFLHWKANLRKDSKRVQFTPPPLELRPNTYFNTHDWWNFYKCSCIIQLTCNILIKKIKYLDNYCFFISHITLFITHISLLS